MPSNFLRLIWVDYSGMLRTKIIPDNGLEMNPKLTKCGMIMTIDGAPAPSASQSCTGEVFLWKPHLINGRSHDKPDEDLPDRQIQIPSSPRHSYMFANLYTPVGDLWIHCPRGILQRAMDLLSRHGLTARAGYELEFVILDPSTGKPWPFEKDMIYCSEDVYDMAAPIIDEICDTLADMGISVRLIHTENGPGQFEIVLQHEPVMKAVENCILARKVVRAVVRRHGKKATFCPVYGSAMGTGGHLHVSLDKHFNSNENELTAGKDDLLKGISKTGQSFIQGIVDGLQWISFPINSSPLSYKRCKPGHWVGVFQTWGINNKEAPVRLAEDRSNVEIKAGDGISNPFLGMAAILTAGSIGISRERELSEPCQVDPQYKAAEMNYARLPEDIGEAMKLFAKKCAEDDDVGTVFPPDVVNDFTHVRQVEASKKDEDLQQIVLQQF